MKEEKKTSQKGLSKMLKRFYGVGDCGFTLMSNILKAIILVSF